MERMRDGCRNKHTRTHTCTHTHQTSCRQWAAVHPDNIRARCHQACKHSRVLHPQKTLPPGRKRQRKQAPLEDISMHEASSS